ncbi:uracil-DNA glycosylase [Aneurinibacillus terranovensis]|uniref:uracil-DNA glycosylase n=1 Tax=Aneurinibacillus terranovensis TaxID=278991 RepID=UPI000487FF6A
MLDHLETDWADLLKGEFEKPYYKQLCTFLLDEYATKEIYPERDNIFSALNLTPFVKTKVVILGQDPYHRPGQAHGLSFSVKPGVTPPPSLKNIFKELHSDIGYPIPNHGYLVKWAKEGVLLLNTVMTVRRGEPNSHKGKGWEIFTDRIISLLNEKSEPIVFILWGSPAQAKRKLITSNRHFIIESSHPSPLSARRGFFGSRPFSRTNECLVNVGEQVIDWKIPDLAVQE